MTAIFCFSYLGLIPTFTPIVQEKLGINRTLAMFYSSFLASSIAIVLSHPSDTIKTNLQGDLGILTRKGPLPEG